MLSATDLKMLTQTGPGTPMGELFRRFWLPAMLPRELPEPDCAPVRLRLLGEDMVAWRNTDGSIGVMQNACPHRGASMFFGRNEENGLRCVYHGWKFDAEGACVDMPNEPAESNFKHKIKAAAYAAAEYGDVIWVYMGPKDLQPELPHLEWALVPQDQRAVHKWFQDCNYAQGMEGDLDTSHVSFLHRVFEPANDRADRRLASNGQAILVADGSPILTVKETDYGFAYGARRNGENEYYWRVTQFLLPGYSMIASADSKRSSGSWLPVDDEHCMGWRFNWDYATPWPADKRNGTGSYPRVDEKFRAVGTKENDYQIDRQMQKTFNFTGILNIREQDTAMTETMGAIMDRTREHLGTTDMAIILYRRQMLRLARALQQGVEPFAASHGSVYRVRALDVMDREGEFEPFLHNHDAELFKSVKG